MEAAAPRRTWRRKVGRRSAHADGRATGRRYCGKAAVAARRAPERANRRADVVCGREQKLQKVETQPLGGKYCIEEER